MNKLNMYEIYKSLYKALKNVYLGELYLIIESITIEFDSDECNEIMALEPFMYVIKGRYGRESEIENEKLDESFSLTIDKDFSYDMIEALFKEKLWNN